MAPADGTPRRRALLVGRSPGSERSDVAAAVAVTCRPAADGITSSSDEKSCRRISVISWCRASYTSRMRRTCRAKWPSTMNSAIAPWRASGVCQSVRNFAPCSAGHSGRWRDDEPQAKRRQGRLREGADVDHATALVERVQWLDWPPTEAELTVVVVLDDHRVVAARPIEQGHAASQGHRHAEWHLVGGGDVDQLRSGGYRIDDQSLTVDRNAAHRCAHRAEQEEQRPIPRVLEGHPVPGSQQDPRDQVDRLLGAVGDHDVVGRGSDAAGDPTWWAIAARSVSSPAG